MTSVAFLTRHGLFMEVQGRSSPRSAQPLALALPVPVPVPVGAPGGGACGVWRVACGVWAFFVCAGETESRECRGQCAAASHAMSSRV